MTQLKNKIGTFCLPEDGSKEDFLRNDVWEEEINNLFAKYLKPESNAIDIGAHIGYHSVGMAKYCNLGHVFAFEPNPDLTTIITQNIAINNCKNITF